MARANIMLQVLLRAMKAIVDFFYHARETNKRFPSFHYHLIISYDSRYYGSLRLCRLLYNDGISINKNIFFFLDWSTFNHNWHVTTYKCQNCRTRYCDFYGLQYFFFFIWIIDENTRREMCECYCMFTASTFLFCTLARLTTEPGHSEAAGTGDDS